MSRFRSRFYPILLGLGLATFVGVLLWRGPSTSRETAAATRSPAVVAKAPAGAALVPASSGSLTSPMDAVLKVFPRARTGSAPSASGPSPAGRGSSRIGGLWSDAGLYARGDVMMRCDTKGDFEGSPAVVVDRIVRVEGYRFPAIRIVETVAYRQSATATSPTPEVVSRVEMVADQLMVNFAPDVTVEQLSAATGVPFVLRKRISGTGTALLAFPVSTPDTVDHVLATLKKFTASAPFTSLAKSASSPSSTAASALVRYAEIDGIVHPSATPNDPNYADGSLWGMHNTGQSGGTADADVDAPEGWDTRTSALATVTQSRSGPNNPAFGPNPLVIAVVDTGVRYTHEDIAANMWTNPGEIPGNGIDDDNNGVIDDVFGVNAIADNGDPMDTEGHGSHCAGTIAAVGNNGKGVAGIAWSARIAACRFIGPDGGSNSDGAEALYYAWEQAGADVISCSWGGGSASVEIENQLLAAQRNGAVVVFAAGNDNTNLASTPTYPAVTPLDNIVTVASTTRTDTRSGFSNYGYGFVNVGAPGSSILSLGIESDTSYATMSGTSMATPLTAGIIGLLRAQFPDETYGQIINRLYRSVDPVADLSGKVQTGGRVNLQKALATTTGAPAHDSFASAQLIPSSSPFTIRSSNLASTAESGEPAHAGSPAAHTVWFKWTAPANGNQIVSTQGSSYGTTSVNGADITYGLAPLDTVLAVYTGSSINSLTSVTSNDDYAPVGGVTQTWSRVTFAVTSGTTYYFAVGASSAATTAEGMVMVNLSQPPPGDDFANANLVVAVPYVSNVSNVNALTEAGEPALLKADVYPSANAKLIELYPTKDGTTNPGGASLWWTWTPAVTQEYILSTNGGAIDTVLGVFTANNSASPAVNALTLVAQNDDVGLLSASVYLSSSRIRQTFTAGTTYYIKVDGFEGRQGGVTLSIAAPPPNDNIAASTPLSGNPVSVNVNNVGASSEPGEPSHAGKNGASSVWFKWTAPATQDYQLDTLTGLLDTLLAVYTAADPASPTVTSLTEIASNDDLSPYRGSYLRFSATAGVTYFFAVDGYNGKQGNNCTLQLGSTPGAMTNDAFADRIPLTGTSARVTSDLNGAITQVGEPVSGASVWWSWTAPASANVTFTTQGSSYGSGVGAYTGTTLTALTEVAKNYPAVGQLTSAYGSISFAAVRGTTYQIVVYNESAATVGPVFLNFQLWTNPGEQGWTAALPAVDRTNNGIDDDNNGLTDDTAVPHNELPVVAAATVTPAATAYADQALIVSGVVTTDAENDAVTVACQWQSSLDGSAWTDATGLTAATLPAADANAGRFWRCRLSPSDATADGNPFYTTPVAVSRRPLQLARDGTAFDHSPDLPLATGLPVLRRSIVFNEFSKGSGTTGGEWVELLVLRDLNMVGCGLTNIFRGFFCKDVPLWQNIPRGTLILIYNPTDKSSLVPPDDYDPFDDGRLVLSATDPVFVNGSDGASGGINLSDSLNGATGARLAIWAANYSYLDSICFADINPLGVPPMNPILPYLPAGQTYRYTGGTEDGNETTGQWELGAADPSFATPGQPNTELNADFILRLRAPAPAYRFVSGNQPVPGLALNATTGQLSGTVNAPAGGVYRVALERSATGVTPVARAWDLLVGTAAGAYTVAPGQSFTLRGDISLANGTLLNNGTLDLGGFSLVQKQSYATWAAARGVTGAQTNLVPRLGIANKLAFALNLDPSSATLSDLPVVTLTPYSGNSYLTFAYRRQKAPNRLAYTVQSSPDLVNWTALDPVAQQVGSPVSLDFATERVTVRDTQPVDSGHPRRFLRLQVADNFNPPAAPASASASLAIGAAQLTWSPVLGAETYAIKRATSPGGPYTTLASDLLGTSYTDSSVATGITYYYVINAATAAEGEGSTTSELTVTTPPSWTPAAPTGLVASPSHLRVQLTWNAVSQAASYIVRRATSPGGPYTTLATGLTSPTYDDNTGLNGLTYYYVVAAVNTFATGADSAEVSTATLPYVWSVDAAGNWSTVANWSAASFPDRANARVTFGPVTTAARAINLDANVTVGSITFNHTTVGANAYNVNFNGNQTLTFAVASAPATLTARGSGGYSLGTQGNGSQIILSSPLAISAGNAQSATGDSASVALNSQLTGSGGLVLSTLASNDGSGTANSGFRGTYLRSTTANTFNGGVTVNSGYLGLSGHIGNAGSGAITLNASDSSSGLGTNLILKTGGGTFANNLVFGNETATGGTSPRLALLLNDATAQAYTTTGTLTGSLGNQQLRFSTAGNVASSLTLSGNGSGLTIGTGGSVWNRVGVLRLNHSSAVGLNNTVGNGTSGGWSLGNTSNAASGSAELLTNGYNVGGRITTQQTTTAAQTSTDHLVLGGYHTSGTATFTGNLTLGRIVGGTRQLQLTSAAGGTTVFSGIIADGAASGSAATIVPVAITGGGVVQLNALNTYTSITTVNNGATLGGTGTVAGALTVASGGKLAFAISTAPGAHDRFDVGGTLTFSGVSTLTITSTSGATTGTYTLVNAASITGNLPTLSLPSGWSATLQQSGGALQLVVSAVP